MRNDVWLDVAKSEKEKREAITTRYVSSAFPPPGLQPRIRLRSFYSFDWYDEIGQEKKKSDTK